MVLNPTIDLYYQYQAYRWYLILPLICIINTKHRWYLILPLICIINTRHRWYLILPLICIISTLHDLSKVNIYKYISILYPSVTFVPAFYWVVLSKTVSDNVFFFCAGKVDVPRNARAITISEAADEVENFFVIFLSEWPAMLGSWTENVVLLRHFFKVLMMYNYWVWAQSRRLKLSIWVVMFLESVFF